MAKNNNYIAFISLGKKCDVIFPDFDGVITQGDTYDEAIQNAHEALSLHVDGMKQDGLDIPAPSTLENIQKNWWGWDDWKNTDFAVAMIALIPQAYPKRYSLMMDSALMARIDRVTKNRSAFLARAAECFLDQQYPANRKAA